MAFYPAIEGESIEILDQSWRMATSPAGACGTPQEAESLTSWIDAPVPGTVAGALERAGLFDRDAPQKLHDKDFWYCREISGRGSHLLRLDGLATLAEVYFDGKLLIQSSNMFHAHEVELELTGTHRLAIVFRALTDAFAKTRPRARWRVQMIPNQGARHMRTTLLGQMPGWCPAIEAVGPWRAISLVTAAPIRAGKIRIQSSLEGAIGHLTVMAELSGAKTATLICGEHRAAMVAKPHGTFRAELAIADIKAWWPHTHGEPALYPIHIEADGQKIDLCRTGFRNIKVDRGSHGDDFALFINGIKIFCRGAVWTSADIVNLPADRAAYEPWLKLARDAGMNMIRISGTMTYETRAFFELCSELGIMVWQEFMFANFDYPTADADFVTSCRREAETFLSAIQGLPSLAVLCGGSEMLQQAAMMGLPTENWSQELTENLLREVSQDLRPDVPYVVNSPSGGPLPFMPNQGVTHYYGVGAYERPLEDARRAEVRFAAECLAFANVPQQATLDKYLPVPPLHDPRWKRGVPRDLAASWDFEDTREFYLKLLFGVDPARLRRENPALWLNASRAVSGEVMEAIFSEWRRVGSTCNGALVWTMQDLVPGAGWGVIDSTGMPKPAYYALKRAFRPQQILLSDEGTNGLMIHCLNETAAALNARIEFMCLQDGTRAVIKKERRIELAPRGKLALSASELIGAFFDTTYAFRFGPPAHDVNVARLFDAATGKLLAEAAHFPLGGSLARSRIDFTGHLLEVADGWILELETSKFLQSVHIECPGFVAEDDWFHLTPGLKRQIRLIQRDVTLAPNVEISALNATNRQHLSA